MAFEGPEQAFLNHEPCRYDGSRLLFRGPRRRLEGEYVAFLGGTETYGKYIAAPFPDLVEEITGITCVNFGFPNAGLDLLAQDAALIDCARRARAVVLQVPCAVNMSNPFYRVHPRRNDRFVQATDALRRLYPEVDFTDFSFTRHMLTRLQRWAPDRFAYIRAELSEIWVTGMRRIVDGIGTPVILLWISARQPETAAELPDLGADPALVNRDMLDALRADVHRLVEIQVSPGAARATLGAESHHAVAEALVPPIADLLSL